jgi:hypothetical protein
VCPGFAEDLWQLAERAAAWRRDVEHLVASLGPWHENRSVFVNASAILSYDRDARAILWPALAARAGIALDKRGTVRLAAFSTLEGRTQRIQLAGGHEIIRRSRTFEIRPAATS